MDRILTHTLLILRMGSTLPLGLPIIFQSPITSSLSIQVLNTTNKGTVDALHLLIRTILGSILANITDSITTSTRPAAQDSLSVTWSIGHVLDTYSDPATAEGTSFRVLYLFILILEDKALSDVAAKFEEKGIAVRQLVARFAGFSRRETGGDNLCEHVSWL